MTPEWVAALIRAAKQIVPADFTGKIEINAFKGGVANVNVQQSFKEGQGQSEPAHADSHHSLTRIS